MAYPDFCQTMHKLAAMVSCEINEAQSRGLWLQINHLPHTAFRRACHHYVYKQKEKYPSSLLRDLRTKTLDFGNDYSDIMPGGVSVRLTAAQLAEDQRLRMEMKQAQPAAPQKRLTARQLAEKFAVPPDVQQRMEQSQQKQIAGLLELKAAKGEA